MGPSTSLRITELTIATRNAHKTREFIELLGPGFDVRDVAGRSDIAPVDETGSTFKENAVLKAVAVSRQIAGLVAADDSGLEVDVLGGAPGIYSARYAGEGADDVSNISKLLHQIAAADSADAGARFRCLIALARAGNVIATFSGVVEGTIAAEPRGSAGFGYDPVFLPAGWKETFAEIPADVKNRISHRARAAAQLKEFLLQQTSR